MSKEKLYSIFDIAGKKEIGITQAFGVILRKDKTLLNKLIRPMIPGLKLNNELFNGTEFSFEQSSAEGRTDIEILNKKLHLIIESKIGTNSIKYEQADRYSQKLMRTDTKYKCFIFLTEIGNVRIDPKLKRNYPQINYGNISWDKTLELLHTRKSIKINIVKEYENYILEAQKMRIFDIDIWGVVVKGEQEKNYNKSNFYINNKRHSPIFIARREWDKKLNKVVINELRPVLRIRDKGTNKKYKNDYIYELGTPLKLEKPIMTKKFTQAGAIKISFDEL